MNGKPSFVAPSPGWIPIGSGRTVLAPVSVFPVKQILGVADEAAPHEAVMSLSLWSVELPLSLSEIGEPKLIDGSGANRPGVCGIDLLGAGRKYTRKIPQVSAGSLKLREGIQCIVIIEVIVNG